MMKRWMDLCACLMLCIALCEARADDAKLVVLFDFEQGAGEWAGNPWKGGKCLFEITNDARFGKQALRGWYEGAPRKDGGTIIGPYFPENADWRKTDWGVISLWVRGDGSASSVMLILEEDTKEHPTFSKPIPLDGKEWQRFSFDLRSFWNRGKRKITAGRLKRLYFGGTPNQSFTVDRIALEAPHREVPIEQVERKGELPFGSVGVLEYEPGNCGVRLIPPRKASEKNAEVSLLLATTEGQKAEGKLSVPLESGGDEVTVPLRIALRKDTTITLDVSAKTSSGKESSARFRFPAFIHKPLETSPYLSICPLPKEMKSSVGDFLINVNTKIVCGGPPSEDMGYCVEILRSEIKKWYGLDLGAAPDGQGEGNITLKVEDVGLPAEGYRLSVTPKGATIRAKDCRALSYGSHTLLQAIAESTETPRSPRVKCVEIADWPDLPMRSARLGLPCDKWGHPNDPEVNADDFLDFLYNTMARYKYNTLVLEMNHGYRYACAPKIGAKHAWGRAELEKIREFCKRHFIEIIPCVNSMGHTGWLLLGYPELRWHDDLHMLCTCNPESYEIMTNVYDELIDIFHPRIFHIGMDEVRWEGNPKEPNPKHCACDDAPTWEQFGRWAKKLHDHLTKRGVRTMMWGDMILPEHNGGPPFFTKRALADVPRDTIIANWSLGVAPMSNFFFKKECGFQDVVQSNSSGVDVEESPYLIGNMFGMWSKTPWLSQRDAPGSQAYCYLALVQAGEFSWNLNRSDSDVAKRYNVEYLKLREGRVLRDLALQPEPRAGKNMKAVDISAVANSALSDLQGEKADVSGINFRLLPNGRCVEVKPGEAKSIPFGGTAASLYFLHAEELPDDEAKTKSFVDRWKSVDNLWGIAVGRYEMVYEDGSVEAMPIKHSWNILPRRMVRTLPYAYRVTGSLRLPGDGADESNALYAAQWVNPHPEKKIKEIRLIGGDTESRLRLFGVTAKEEPME